MSEATDSAAAILDDTGIELPILDSSNTEKMKTSAMAQQKLLSENSVWHAAKSGSVYQFKQAVKDAGPYVAF